MCSRTFPSAAWRVVLALQLFQAPLLCQEQGLDFSHLSVEDGLSHGSVYSITQDSLGFLWIATEDGLNRYDGVRLLVFRHEPGNDDSLASSNFGEVLQTQAGDMWFGTWGGGLDRFDPTTSTFTHYRHDPDDARSLSQDRIEVLFEDSSGSLWIGTESAGLNRFEPTTGTFVRYRQDSEGIRSPSNSEIRAIAEDSTGALWIGSNGGLSRYDRGADTFSHYRHDPADPWSLSSDRVRAIAQSRSGELWIGTRGGGLNRLDLATGRFHHVRHQAEDPQSLGDDSVSCVLEDSFGILWIGTYHRGLNRLDPETGLFRRFRYDEQDPRSLRHDYVETIYEDRGRNLWIGTRGGGLNKLDLKPAKFRNYDHLPLSSVRAIAENGSGDDGSLWIGTDGGGLLRFDATLERFETLGNEAGNPEPLSGHRIWSLAAGRAGIVWVGTYSNGLHRLQPEYGSYRVTRYRHDPASPSSIASDRVQAILEDRDGTLWLGTNQGLDRATISPDGELEAVENYQHDPETDVSLSDDYVSVILRDRSGALWLGTRRGLNRLDEETETFLRFYHDPEDQNTLSGDIVYDIHEDEHRAGTLWIGTEGSGLNRFDVSTGRSRRYLADDGLPANTVAGILEDEGGQLWLSTSRGLSKFDPETEQFRNYGISDGLKSHGFFRNADLEAANGVMYFGGVSGLTSLSPAQVIDNPHLPPIALTSIRVNGQDAFSPTELEDLEALELSFRENFLAIEFAALEFTAPEANQYAYRLQGVDPDWVRAGNRPYASYAGLQPGTYSFEVKAANNNGVWNEESRHLKVRVRPPWWQRWWLRLGAAVALAAMIGGGHWLRTRAISSRNRMLETVNKKLNDQIVERQRTEREKERLIEELGAKAFEMERFIYTVSHDLKSPLITIKGFLGMARRDAAAGEIDRMNADLERIGVAADRMHYLLDDLLELSRIGRVLNPPQEVELRELALEACKLVAGQIDEIGAEVEVAPDLPVAFGDRDRLLLVFQNLIDNAAKFSARQPDPRIVVGWKLVDGETAIFVQDNGLGIDPRYATRVFKLFERLDSRTPGTGVGLALVKRIIELHEGRIWVESEGQPGRGSTFFFTLPEPPSA